MATLKNTTVNDTGFLTVPVGTVAQRPASPAQGMIRLCTNNPGVPGGIILEYYTGTEWKALYIPNTVASGGTVTTSGSDTIHTFTSGSSSLVVSTQ